MKISIVIPTLNEEKYIERSVKSVLSQTVPEGITLEIVVVDNGSTDDTVKIAKSIQGIRVLMLPGKNVGAVRNHGAINSVGEYIVFMDSDCLMPENHIFSLMQIVNRNSGVAAGGGIKLPDNPKWIEKFWLLEGKYGESLPSQLIGGFIFCKRSEFVSAGMFNEDVTAGEDSNFHERLLKIGVSIVISRDFSVTHLGNAKTIKDFVRRQRWHSENYFDISSGYWSDKIFWVSFIYLVSLITTIAYSPIYISISILLSVAFTVRRYVQAFRVPSNIYEIFLANSLDHLYFISRSISIVMGVVCLKWARFRKN